VKNGQPSVAAAGFLFAAALAGAAAAADHVGYDEKMPAAPLPPLSFQGGMLVNSSGMTVYAFDKDVPGNGKSACHGPCATLWPPVLAMPKDQGQGPFAIVMRDDGERQWAFKGKPLYTWSGDKQPGDKNGDNFNNVWHIVPH
jgi:predicted lipoprotein with Yx(FWY)xxD motif